MLNELISWVLNTYLGKYLEDFNPQQLSVALLSGEVELENVPIRKDALRSFGIPVQAHSGNIGKIKLQIPVRQFRTAPWCIIIERIYGVFGPKDLDDWDDEREKVAEYEFKVAELDAKEAKWRVENGYQIDTYYSNSYTSWLNYGTTLATNILQNLELKIKDVHIRYEDALTVKGIQFAAGIKINSLTVQSCDANWQATHSNASNEQNVSYKLIELNDFSLYWDCMTDENKCSKLLSKDLLAQMNEKCNESKHHYLLHPISARAHFKRECCRQALRSKSKPRINCEFLVQEVKVTVTDVQYKEIVNSVYGLRQISRTRKFKLIRPSCSVFENAALWWQYAAKCHGFEYHSSESKWLKAKENLHYMRIYKRLLINPNENITSEEKELKAQLEKARDLHELHTLRNICRSNVFTNDVNLKANTINHDGKGMLFHWFPNWWGWYGNNAEGGGGSSVVPAQDEAYKNIENDILNALEDTMENDPFSKRDAIFGYFSFILVDGQLIIKTEDVVSRQTTINFEMDFQNLMSFIEMKPKFSSYTIGISLGSVCLKDKLTQNTEFPFLIRPQFEELPAKPTPPSTGYQLVDFKRLFMREQQVDSAPEPWFQLRYEKGPPDIQSDTRLVIKSRSLDIVYNKNAFDCLKAFFVQPINDVYLNYKLAKSNRKRLMFLQNWQQYLVGNEDFRTTWSLEIDISAPRIIFADNHLEKNTGLVLVDFGRFQMLKNECQKRESLTGQHDSGAAVSEVTSKLGKDSEEDDENFMTPCSTPPGSEASLIESPTMPQNSASIVNTDTGLESAFHRKIYDKYFINLTDLQVVVCKNRERNHAFMKHTSNFHLLEKFSICLELERRVIYTIDPDYPSLTLYGTLPKIVAHVNEQKLNEFFKILYPIITDRFAVSELKNDYGNTNKKLSETVCREAVVSGIVGEENVNGNSNDFETEVPPTFLNTNLMVIQFVIGQMTLEVQSLERSIAELQVIGARAGITKRSEDTHISMSVHGLLLVDAIQSFGPDFELLVASHRHVGMDSISGSLKQSKPCSPTTPSSPDPMLGAAERCTSPHTINRAISALESGRKFFDMDYDESQALINIDLNLIDSTDQSDSLQIANIAFNNLDIIANQETIVELLGFAKRLHNTHETIFQRNHNFSVDSNTHNINKKRSDDDTTVNLRTEICFDFNRLNILVLRSINKGEFSVGRKVGTLTMSEAKIHATFGEDISVTGSLGGVQIIDITPEGVNHQRIFSVGKDPLTNDTQEFYKHELLNTLTNELYNDSYAETQLNALSFQIYCQKDSTPNLKIRMASVWYVHCPRFIQEINMCISQFKHYLKNFATSIRNKASDMAKELVQHIQKTSETETENLRTAGQISIDVVLNTPVLVLPRSGESLDVLVANLGKITAYNTHEENEISISKSTENLNMWARDNYFIDIRNINLFSLNTSKRKELGLSALPKVNELYACNTDAVPILHDTAMLFKLTKFTTKTKKENQWTLNNAVNIEGSITQCLQISLSRSQYEQVLDTLNSYSKSKSNNGTHHEAHAVINSVDQPDSGLVPKYGKVNDEICTSFEENYETNLTFSVPIFQIHLKNKLNNALIDVTFRDFSFQYNQQNDITHLEVLLRSILMEDLKCAMDSRFRNMVDSTSTEKEIIYKTEKCLSCPNLTNMYLQQSELSQSMPCKLNYPSFIMATAAQTPMKKALHCGNNNATTKTSDDKLVTYKAITQIIVGIDGKPVSETKSSIDFNCLNLTISVSRWFTIFDFFGLVSTYEVKNTLPTKNELNDDEPISLDELKVSVRSLNLILVRNEIELSKANISHAHFKIARKKGVKSIEGRLKSISLYDLTHFGDLYREKFSTAGPEALSFSYKSLNDDVKSNTRSLDMNAKLRIQMSSVRYIHTKRFIMEIHLFLKDLLELQSPVIRRIKMSESQADINAKPIKIGLRIHAASPIVLMPLSYNSNQVIVADLGEFTMKNSFHFASDEDIVVSKRQDELGMDEILDVMHIDLVNMNVFSGERIWKTNKALNYNPSECVNIGNFIILKLGKNLFKETCHLKLQVERNIDTAVSHNCADITVKGVLTKLNGIVNLQQYKLLRGFLSYNLGEMIDDVYGSYRQQNIYESVDKLNNVSESYNSADTLDMPIWTTMSINLQLENVSVSLIEQQNYDDDNDEMIKSLACINFIKSFLKIDTFSDGAQDIDLVSSEVLVLDTRPEQISKNVFRHILKPKRDKCIEKNIVQAEIHSRKRNNTSKYTILLNNMRLMAILDCLESIKKFLEEEPTISSTVTPSWRNNKIFKQTSQSTHDSSGGSELKAADTEIILNITDSEVIFVENVELPDTNAIILKNTTVLQHKPNSNVCPLSIDVNHLEVFSCILGAEEESALSIIDPFSLNMELKNNCFNISIHKQLSIRLSYNDVKLFSKMLQSIPNQTKTSQKNAHRAAKYANFEIVAPLISMGFTQKDCWEAMEVSNYNLNDAAMWLTQQKYLKTDKAYLEVHDLLISANCISICVIDDCMDADVPLLEIALSQLTLAQHLCNEQSPLPGGGGRDGSGRSMPLYQEGRLETIFASDYYNRRLSGWEPVIEPWECSAHWQHTSRNVLIPKMLVMQVSSKQLLKMNITSTLIELCDIVRNNWIKDYYSQGSNSVGLSGVVASCSSNSTAVSTAFRRRSPFVPFALSNLTGEPLHFKIHSSAPGGITRTEVNPQDIMCDWLAVQPNEILPFNFGPQTKLRHMNSHKLNTHQILVQIQGWTLIGPISIDKVGVFFRYSTLDMQYKKRTRIVFDISMFGSAQKMITIRSALTVVNRLNERVLLKMEAKHENNVALSVVESNAQLSVPLRLVDSLIYFRPYPPTISNTNNSTSTTNKTPEDLMAHATDGKTIFVRKNSILRSNRSDDLEFSTCGISWTSCSKDSVDELFSCYGKNNAVFYTLVEIRKVKYPNRDLNTPGHNITLLPPLKLKNMLSCDLLFKISGHIQGRINSAEVVNIHTINACDSFVLSITLDNYKLSGQLKIPMGHTGIVEPKLKLIDILNRELYLRVSIQSFQGKGMEIFISAPIWIINRTGLPLVYRQEGTNRLGSGQFEEHEQARIVSPLLFSFSDQEGSPSLEIRLGNSYGNNNPWCKSFNIHKETFQRQLRAERYKGCYAIGINIRRGRGLYSWTTFVILSPRYQLYNKSTRKLEFSQKCDIKKPDSANAEHIISAMPGSNFPFHWPNYEQEPLLCVRISDVSFCHWSHGIPINEVHSIYINIRNDLGEMFFLRLEVISKGATYFFIFSDAHTLPPPIRIDNYSEIMIHFYQYGCKPHWRSTVRSQSSLAYALDDPLGAHMLQIEAPGGNTIEFPLNKMGNSNSITYANFIYIAFKETFAYTENEMSQLGIEGQQLVLAVRDKKVIVAHKCTGDRSQLWLMNSFGQLEHEGSSPPTEYVGKHNESYGYRMVLDVETALNPNDYTNLVVRPPNKQRVTTQRWRFENGRLMCHTNMCVQVRNGVFGLRPGSEVVLGRIQSSSRFPSCDNVPFEQNIEIQKLRPGSGHLEIVSKMDGPIRTIQIHDVKLKPEDIQLTSDPNWNHASISSRMMVDEHKSTIFDDFSLNVDLQRGLGISVVTRQPCEELAFITLETIIIDVHSTRFVKSFEFKVADLQIDNQLLDSSCSVLLHTARITGEDSPTSALILKTKLLPSPNKNAIIFEYLTFDIKPFVLILEERLILKTAYFFGLGRLEEYQTNRDYEYGLQSIEELSLSTKSRRFYFATLNIGSSQVRVSVLTAPKLTPELCETKKTLGLTLIKFEDAIIEFDKFSDKHHFEPLEVYIKAIKGHYVSQIKRHAASILGSVDFLGNPLGFANDLSEGVSGLIFEGSVKSLVKNVTHGISNSTAKLTETLSDSLGRVALDEHDNEARQRILEIQSNTSGNHLAAGLKGLGFGLLGGVTSIVRHTYTGAQADGFPGLLSGFGKGLVGTVTKPIIGVLDLAAETASAVRETSKTSGRTLPDRKRLPRCVTGAPGGLLPAYSYRQAKGQQYLYIINRRNFSEKLMSYEPNLCNDKDAKLRLLVTTEFIRIFSRCEEDPAIMFECHLSEVLSCHPLTTNVANAGGASSSKHMPSYYIEISTNLPKITRPRVKCQNEEIAERAARCINYAKSVFDEREQSVTSE